MMTPIIMMHLHGTKVYSVYTFSYLPNDVSGGVLKLETMQTPIILRDLPYMFGRGGHAKTRAKKYMIMHACNFLCSL